MARRRRITKAGLPKREHLTSTDKKRSYIRSLAYMGRLDCKRFGFCATKLGKLDYCVFKALFAAKMYLDLMIGDDEIDWVNDRELETSSGVYIEGPNLRKIYDYKLKPAQVKYFALQEDELKRIAHIRNDKAAPLFENMPSTVRRRKSRRGMTLMKTIAEDLGIAPRTARGILREMGYKKPERGWAWETQKEVDEIKAILQGEPRRRITVDFTHCKKP